MQSPKEQAPTLAGSLFRAWFPTLLLLCVVAVESTASFGADHTSPFLYRIYVWFFGPTTYNRWWLIHMFLRKSGHICGFCLLSASLFRSWLLTLRIDSRLQSSISKKLSSALHRNARILAVVCALIVAVFDEIHQSFVPNRNGSVQDVLIDLAAAIAAQLLIWLFFYRSYRNSEQKTSASRMR